jgi:hypothetical protein
MRGVIASGSICWELLLRSYPWGSQPKIADRVQIVARPWEEELTVRG